MAKQIDVKDKAWNALGMMTRARKTAKSLERELVQTRKDLENQLNELGAGSTDKHLKVSREYVITIRSIDFERDRLKSLADQMEKTIDEALQGKFEFADDLDERAMVKRPAEKDLFTPPKDEEPPAKKGDGASKDKRPVGRPGKPGKPKPEAPDPSKGDGVDEHLNASVNELDVRENLKTSLVKAGLTTVGRVVVVLDGDNAQCGDLAEKADIDPSAARQVAAAVKRYRTEHRKAARTAEEALA